MNVVNVRRIVLLNWEERGLGLARELMQWGLFPEEGVLKCPLTGHNLHLIRKGDDFEWYCGVYTSNKKGKHRCMYRVSLRTGTFFAKSHLSYSQLCIFINLWVYNINLNVIGPQAEIYSNRTLVYWSSLCREVCYDIVRIRMIKIGGPGKIVELVESKFGKRNFHRSRHVEAEWVFGGIQRDSGASFLVPVDIRNHDSLLTIIKEWILPGTIIMSDFWKSYECLSAEGYHLKVNDSISFVNTDSEACSNSLEGTVRTANRHYNSSSRRKHFYAGYLAKYVFFKQCRIKKKDPFVAFMESAGTLYNPNSEVENECDDDSEYESGESAEEFEFIMNY